MMKRLTILCSLCLLASVAWAARTPVEIKADLRSATAALKATQAANGDVSAAKSALVALNKELATVTPRRAATLDDGGETCESATNVNTIPYTDFGVISEETEDDYEYAEECGLDGADLVYQLHIGPNGLPAGSYTFSTCGSYFDTVIELWDGCPGSDNGTLVDCNDDLSEDDEDPVCLDENEGLSSCISNVELTEGTYYLVLFGYNFDMGDYELNINTNGECGGNNGQCAHSANNSYCESAQELELDNNGEVYVFGRSDDGARPALEGCWDSVNEYVVDIDACGLWYTVTGTGNLMQANTCDEETDYDTEIHVFTGYCDGLECVTANDDWIYRDENGDPIYLCQSDLLASGVEWCSEAGQVYYIFVGGYDGETGNFGLKVEDTGEPCAPPCEEEWYYFDPLDVPFCQCLTICPGQIQKIFVGPAGPNDRPVASWDYGCRSDRTIPPSGCEEDCQPADPQLYMDWIYLPDQMQWCMDLYSREGGCYCFCIDRILPVELNSFSAVAGDREVTINWSTASETDADRFEILRDGLTVASLDAQNSATGAAYSWTDRDLDNGTSYDYTLALVNLDGSRETLASESVTPNASAVASEFALFQNYPNPFNPVTNISFNLAASGPVSLKVYNLAGQEVTTLVAGTLNAGQHLVSFDGAGLSSGVYLYRLEANGQVAQHKMVLLK